MIFKKNKNNNYTRFAKLTACVLLNKFIPVYLFTKICPTPFVVRYYFFYCFCYYYYYCYFCFYSKMRFFKNTFIVKKLKFSTNSTLYYCFYLRGIIIVVVIVILFFLVFFISVSSLLFHLGVKNVSQQILPIFKRFTSTVITYHHSTPSSSHLLTHLISLHHTSYLSPLSPTLTLPFSTLSSPLSPTLTLPSFTLSSPLIPHTHSIIFHSTHPSYPVLPTTNYPPLPPPTRHTE